MEMKLIKAEDFGLEPAKVATIEQAFAPVIIERDALIQSYEAIVTKELTPSLANEAKTLRLKLVKVRTSIAATHKTQKEYSLTMGRFIDAWKNKETEPVSQMEAKLSEIETYFEKLESERLEAIKKDRIEKLSTVCDNASIFSVEIMTDEAFESLFEGQKLAKEARDKAAKEAKEREEKEAEEKRLAEIEAEKQREAQRLENERLKKEAQEREAQIEKERKENEAKAAKIKAENEAKLKAEQAERDRIQKEMNDKLEAERKANEAEKQRLQKEIDERVEKERKENEAKLEAERLAKLEAEKAAKAPLKDKLTAWINETKLIAPIGTESNERVIDILAKFNAFQNWAKNEISKI